MTCKKFLLRLKGVKIKELFDHLNLDQVAFRFHFARKFNCVTTNAVQPKKTQTPFVFSEIRGTFKPLLVFLCSYELQKYENDTGTANTEI